MRSLRLHPWVHPNLSQLCFRLYVMECSFALQSNRDHQFTLLACLWQTSRHKDGVNSSTATTVQRGRMYVQALLHELGKGDIEEWGRGLGELNDGDLRMTLSALLKHLHQKVQRGEKWTNLPADAVGGSVREMRGEVPKVISMALIRLLNDAWRSTTTCNVGRMVPVGYFKTYSFMTDTEQLLKQKGAELSVASGNEAKQRREQELFDHEQLLLFESILSCSVAEYQREKGEHPRHPTDNLNLGMIVALQFALGKRCMNVWHRKLNPLRISYDLTSVFLLCDTA